MKVKCIKLPEVISRNCLQQGRIYTVLEIYADSTAVYYRFLTDEESTAPGLYSSDLFTVEDNKVPASWVVAVNDSHTQGPSLQLAPARWTVKGFWDKYFDFDEEACQCFDELRKKLLLESS